VMNIYKNLSQIVHPLNDKKKYIAIKEPLHVFTTIHLLNYNCLFNPCM